VYDASTVVPTTGTPESGYYFRDEIVLAQKDGGGTGRIVLYGRVENPTGGGDVQMFYNNFLGAKQNKASVGTLQRGTWQHVAIVCDPANRQVTYYIDGVRDQTVTCNAFEACTGGFRIGAHKSGTQSFWTGQIDELYLFKGMLSGDEIRALRDNTYFDIYGNPELPEPENDLAFYYPFDNNFNDMSDNNYPLTPSANVPVFSEGRYGAALSLDGNAQYLDLDATGIISTSTAKFTVCAWVLDEDTNPPTQPSDNYLFKDEVVLAQKDGDGAGRIILYGRLDNLGENGATRAYFQNILGNQFNAANDGSLVRGVWKHVAVACDATAQTVTFYIDGVKDKVVSTPLFEACTGGFRIGAHKSKTDAYWTGKIDELYLFRNILSDEDIVNVRDNTYFSGTRIPVNNLYGWNVIYDKEHKTLQIVSPFSAVESIAVYSAAGILLQKASKTGRLSVSGLSKGVYIVKVVGVKGNTLSRKIVID
jgi:hypothetical protein